MDAKVKKVLGYLLKKGGEHDAFDMSIALKMDEEFVEKTLNTLTQANLVACRRDEKNNAFWSAAEGAAALTAGGAKKEKAEKTPKPKKVKAEAEDDGSADDDDDDFPKKAGGGCKGHVIAAAASVVVAVALSMVLGGASGKINAAKEEIRAEYKQEIQTANEKITKLEGEKAALEAKVNSLDSTMKAELARRPVPAARPAAARPAARGGRR
ncbi:MAG: hypothetical protein LBU70_07445 [Chitinispirillales bacterium]|jgi:hypothetical protein|nr:hypothetical protein [Chitinispirillales bacterium]